MGLYSIIVYLILIYSTELKPISKPTRDDLFKIEKPVYMTGYDRFHEYRKISESGKNIILEYAVILFFEFLRKGRLSSNNPEHISLVVPMIDILYQCLLKCKDNTVLKISVKCLTRLINWNITELDDKLKDIVDILYVIMKTSGSTIKSEITQICIKCITYILITKRYIIFIFFRSYIFTNDQIKYVLSMISVDIEDTAECKYNFGYLQAVVNRHIRITEVYFNFII